jgi:hypothetical protein
MEASTRIIDYHLEERIEGKKPKIALSRKEQTKFPFANFSK